MGNKYTSIPKLQEWESDRHLCNLAVDRTGAVITDGDVVASLNATIETASRDFDGHAEGYVDLPFDDYLVPASHAVPDGIEVIVRGRVLWLLWQRRGRGGTNPHDGLITIYNDRVKEIRRGEWKFRTAGDEQVDPKPIEHMTVRTPDDEALSNEDTAIFKASEMKDYTDP